jgi:anaerobic magnesium-protoporphyrin IX monomethyl ester cyclase
MTDDLDLLLVTPPSRVEVYQGLSNDLAAIEPPVWSTLIAEFVRRRGIAVDILDAEALGLTHQETADAIAEADAALTVYVIYGQQPSASTQCMAGGARVCRLVQQVSDRPSLVMGTHASALPERTLREEPYSYVCHGEGPQTILALLSAIDGKSGLSAAPGLWYWRDGEPVGNPMAPKFTDLDESLPGQAWDLLDMSKYRAHNWQCLDDQSKRMPYASLQTSLGCPYQCSFCCINAPFGGHGIRYWSPDHVIRQIDILVNDYGVKVIKIPDEMFVLNKNHVLGICDRIIERGYDLNIWAYARIDTIQPVFLDKLRKAGFQWLGLGIESASKFVRDGVTKGGFGDEDIATTVQRVRDQGIYVSSNFIFGLPDDTHDSMQETLDLALELNTEWANFYSAMAYPGSSLYAHAQKRGWALPDDPGGPGWLGYSQHAYETLPLPTEHLRAGEILAFRDQAFDTFFKSADYLSLIGRTFGPDAIAHIEKMTRHSLRRKYSEATLAA